MPLKTIIFAGKLFKPDTMVTIEQIKALSERRDALRRYL
jgi:hypothetical protein